MGSLKKVIAVIGTVILIAGIAVGSFYAGVEHEKTVIKNAVNAAFKNTPASTTDSKSTAEKDPKQQIKDGKLFGLNEPVQYATLSMKVNSVKTDTLITSYGQAYPAPAGTKWLIVNMTATNTSKQPFNMPEFVLTSDDGTVIEADTSAATYGETSIVSKSLNPGVPVTGDAYYSIPSSLKTTNIGALNSATNKYQGVKLTF